MLKTTCNCSDATTAGARCAETSSLRRALLALLWVSIVAGCSEIPVHNDPEPLTFNPKVDHHLHLVSPRVVEVSRGPALPSVEVPPHIDQLLQQRANAWNNAGVLAQFYTPDAKIVVDQWYRISGIFQGAEVAADHLSKRFGRPYELTPVTFNEEDDLAHLVGYYTRGAPPSRSRFGYFTISLVKGDDEQWRISAESASFPREQPLSPVSAEQIVTMLDEAGIEHGVVHSAAVVFGGQWVDIYRPSQTVQERHALVQAENDWNAEQAARYPQRLLSFCSFHLLDPFAVDELRRCKATGHAGLKLHFDVDGTDFLNPAHRAQAAKVFSAANELGMPVMAHVQNNEGSFEDTLTRYRFFLDEVVSVAPDIPVQIAHLWGGGDFSEGGLKAFAELVESGHPSTRNLYFDIGDVPRVVLQHESDKVQAIARMVVEQSRRIGVERILFGSDGGMEGFQSPGEAWQALVEHFPFTRAELTIIANNVAPYINRSAIHLPSVGADAVSTGSEESTAVGALDPRFDGVREEIRRLLSEDGVPSISVAVAQDAQILWQESFGWANREQQLVATTDTPYSIASINKAITSTGVMMLSERGELDLDAPLESYLGTIQLKGLIADASEVTARRAMAHSAGLPQYFRTVYAGEEMPSAEQMLDRYGLVVFPPREHFQYSNVGYRALDVAIANVSGKRYGDFLSDEIFGPLGMERSSLYVNPALSNEIAVRYDYQQNPIPMYRTDHPGSGDVWASVHDMLRFGMFHLGTLLPDQAVILERENVLAMQQLASLPQFAWGLGWHLTDDRGHRLVEHGGGQPGVSTQLSLYPNDKLAIVVLSNRSGGQANEIARKIAASLLPDKEDIAETSRSPAAQTSELSLSELRGKWTGELISYERAEPLVLIFHEDGDVHARIGGRLTSLVNNISLGSDTLRGSFNGMMNTSETDPHQHILDMTMLLDDDELAGELIARVSDPIMSLPSFVRLERPDPADLDQYVGQYRHGEGDIRTIMREVDRLYSKRGDGGRYELDPFGKDTFLMVGTEGSILEFERENGQIVGVRWKSDYGESGPAPRIDPVPALDPAAPDI